ncbi:hypothetical protein ACS0TY_032127 [Phlomoides rotata]
MENSVCKVEKSVPLYIYLNDLNFENNSRCVLVRLLRTWEARNFKRNKELMNVDMLLLDEKDNLIQGSIHHQLLYKFRDKLKEGRIFLIRVFEVFRSGSHYKLTDHEYMIRFTDATIFEEAVEENYVIRPEKFRLHNHNELCSLIDRTEDLPDMIGFLCKIDTPGPSGQNKAKRVILHIYVEEFRLEVEVEDESDTTTFVIIDKDARQMMKTTITTLMTEKEQDVVKDEHDRAPASILNIVGKMFKFLVKVTSYNFIAKYQSFTVLRIVEDISKFDTEAVF